MKRQVTVRSEGKLTVGVISDALISLPSYAVVDLLYVTNDEGDTGYTLTIEGKWS